MTKHKPRLKRWALVALSAALSLVSAQAMALTTKSGPIGIQGIIPSPPPSRAATISVPANGQSFSNLPISVSGLCPTGLLIKIFDNNAFVGSTVCQGGSYTLQIDLFSGQNALEAIDYDALDQAGPASNQVTVSYTSSAVSQLGLPLSISSTDAERGAAPASELDWPILLNGGTAPYAISVDWGDGSPPELVSAPGSGNITIKHTYQVSGLYKVIVRASDKNGQNAFLQLVGQATGAIQSNSSTKNSGGGTLIIRQVLWWPALIMLPLIATAFWSGRRFEVANLKKRLERIRLGE